MIQATLKSLALINNNTNNLEKSKLSPAQNNIWKKDLKEHLKLREWKAIKMICKKSWSYNKNLKK